MNLNEISLPLPLSRNTKEKKIIKRKEKDYFKKKKKKDFAF